MMPMQSNQCNYDTNGAGQITNDAQLEKNLETQTVRRSPILHKILISKCLHVFFVLFLSIVSLSSDRQTIFINESLKYKHISWSGTIGSRNVSMAAEVGLLTRNIAIEGADDGRGVLDKQLFGCRVLIGSVKGHQDRSTRRVRIENVEFRHCGQEGWSDYYDPRYGHLQILVLSSLG